MYSGQVSLLEDYFTNQALPIPVHENPAEFLVDLCNLDFQREIDPAADVDPEERLQRLVVAWATESERVNAGEQEKDNEAGGEGGGGYWKLASESENRGTGVVRQTWVLLHRLWLKSYRDLLPYWIRVFMYLGK